MKPIFDHPCDRAHRHGIKGQIARSDWTVAAVWDGPKGIAAVDTNNRGGYRVRFGETTRLFKGYAASAANRDRANNFAKSLSGVKPYTREQLERTGNFASPS